MPFELRQVGSQMGLPLTKYQPVGFCIKQGWQDIGKLVSLGGADEKIREFTKVGGELGFGGEV